MNIIKILILGSLVLFSFREAYGKPQVAEESDSEKVAEESDSEKVKKFLIDKYIRYINDKGIKFPPIVNGYDKSTTS